jgi:hypothetical protein
MLARGEPDLISNSALLKNGRDKDMNDLSSKIRSIIAAVKPECKIYLLVIPQKAQVNSYYQSTMQAIGFEFGQDFSPGADHYPFIEKLKMDFQDNPAVKIINPLTILREKDSDIHRMFYLQDEHLSPAGQGVVKELVRETLSRE